MSLQTILEQLEHRPWPRPAAPWIMAQRWCDLLFAHWPIPVATMQALIPAPLVLDTFDGTAWIGIVPFRMENVRPRGLPAAPWISAFPELNVRTYVKSPQADNPKPGVFFFSLEAANPVAVALARRFFHLPYFNAQMRCDDDGKIIHYDSQRTHAGAAPAEFRARYGPDGAAYTARPGTLERWLTERYSLYALDPRKRLYIGEIHHLLWPLQPAQAEIEVNTMTQASGLTLPAAAPLLHFARRLDVAVWGLRPVNG